MRSHLQKNEPTSKRGFKKLVTRNSPSQKDIYSISIKKSIRNQEKHEVALRRLGGQIQDLRIYWHTIEQERAGKKIRKDVNGGRVYDRPRAWRDDPAGTAVLVQIIA
jgi:hypothetical protein